jgi:phasin family protein
VTDNSKDAVDTAANAAEATAEAVQETVSTAEAAPKRAAADVVKQVKKNSRRAKAQRRTRRAKPTARTAAAHERNDEMNTNSNNWFAGFGAVPAAPFQSLFADAGERGQEAVRRTQKAAEEIADLTRANVEAFVEAGKIAAEGARSIGQDAVESGREGVEQAADAVRSLAEAKSPTEFVQLQTELARSSFDRLVADSSRLTESLVKLAGEAFQPISTRASLNAERLNKLVA